MKKENCGYLKGGQVKGPGTGTSDSIPATIENKEPARLSDGEFVVKSKVVSQPGMLEFLKALNEGKIKPQKFNEGGLTQSAKDFAKWMVTPGKVQQDYSYSDGSKISNPGNIETINPVAPANTAYPDQKSNNTALAPVPGINPQVLQNRMSAIESEPNELKKTQMKSALIQQIRNLQLNPEQEQQAISSIGFKDGGHVSSTDNFDPDAYLAENQDNFNPDQYLKETENTPQSDISAARAALVGAGQGATLGFGEELTAPFVAAAGMIKGAINPEDKLPSLPDEGPIDKLSRLSQTYRDVAREEQQKAEEQHPGSYLAGQLTGGLITPGLGAGKALEAVKDTGVLAKVATGAATGAGLGGIAGAGGAEGSLPERLPEAIEGAKTGAVIGAAIPSLGQALKSSINLPELPIVSKTTEAFKRGMKGENLITETGRREAADIVRKKSGELYNDIKTLQKDIGKGIGSEIKAAEDSGSKVDLSQEIPQVLEKLQKIKEQGSQEAASYATSIESEINKLLESSPDSQVIPSKAQDLKQVLENYSPKKGITRPQEIEAAGLAKELKNATSSKLNGLTVNLPELNQQYGAIKDSLKRLGVKENRLPAQIQEKVNNLISKLGAEGLTGDNARSAIEDVIGSIKKVQPELANKYASELSDISGRLKLSGEITKGLQQGLGLGTFQSMAKAGANVAGLTAKKIGIPQVAKATKSFTEAVLESNPVKKAAITNSAGQEVVGSIDRATTNILHTKPKEFYQVQRQVATASENADPETLKEQAQNIRNQHGSQGEQLATMLDNMANKDKDGRRALMFTILQNPNYRKMLGVTTGEE